MLLRIPNVLSPQQVNAQRQQLSQANWIDGRETVGLQGAQVKANLQLPQADPLRHRLGQDILAVLNQNSPFFAAALPHRTLLPHFNCFQNGGYYGFHVDNAVMTMPSEANQLPQHFRSDLSCTIFLSDPESYDGGELVISDTYGEHHIKLPAGDLVLYPSSSLHQVTAVTRGSRVAAILWIQSLIREPARRQMLFELDQTIQQLSQQAEQRHAALRLTHIYHNLLREWAQT